MTERILRQTDLYEAAGTMLNAVNCLYLNSLRNRNRKTLGLVVPFPGLQTVYVAWKSQIFKLRLTCLEDRLQTTSL